MSPLQMFIPITKVDAAQRLVYGIATGETEDRSGEICDYATTKPYYEAWSGDIAKSSGGKSLGNLRAMHGKVAAGKVTEITFNDDAKQIEICAKVVDDAEWKKVEEGVYTGFSQGGSYIKRWKDDAGLQRYTASPSEVSLVDLPCLPTATFEMIKADGATEMKHFADEVTVKPPSNDEVAKRADDLAKAAGDGANVADFFETAREQLVKESKVATVIEPAVTEEPKDLEQVWKAKDGKTFAKKDEAIAHNAEIGAKAAVDLAAAPVLDAIANIRADLIGEPAAPETAAAKKAQLFADLQKWAGKEAWDAAAAIDCIETIYALIDSELWEDEAGEEGQIEMLRQAIARLKEFVASEIKEEAEPMTMSFDREGLAKAVETLTAERDGLQKAITETILPAVADLRKSFEEKLADLKKAVDAQPVPTRLIGRAISKAEDQGVQQADAESLEKQLSAMSPEEQALLVLKIAQKNPQLMALNGR